ncbi:MAG: hypothetical protein ACE37E_06310 [Hyphomicrobiales bacterium]
MTDLELSEKVVAEVLVRLFERGLLGLDIHAPSDVTGTQIDEAHLLSLMLWLEREGLVAFDFADASSNDGRKARYLQTVLTSKGFAALGYQFGEADSLTLGQAAKQVAAGEGSFIRAGSFVGGLLGGFTKSIG